MILRRGSNQASPGGRAAQAPPPRPAEPAPIVTGRFEHDLARRQMKYCGQALDLTLHEYRLLEVLLQHPGRVYSRSQLLERPGKRRITGSIVPSTATSRAAREAP